MKSDLHAKGPGETTTAEECLTICSPTRFSTVWFARGKSNQWLSNRIQTIADLPHSSCRCTEHCRYFHLDTSRPGIRTRDSNRVMRARQRQALGSTQSTLLDHRMQSQ